MTLKAFTAVSGPAAPLLRANIDTDIIIRIEHLTQTAKGNLGRFAMEALRYLPNGQNDPSFILNKPVFCGAPILIAGPNFGCGSSREHAVWALLGTGLRCVIAPSFGDIFYANCFQNGLLPIRISIELVEELARQCADGAPLAVDLLTCTISAPDGHVTTFNIDARRREMLLRGLDDIGLTQIDEEKIVSWQSSDKLRRPWAWPTTKGDPAKAAAQP